MQPSKSIRETTLMSLAKKTHFSINKRIKDSAIFVLNFSRRRRGTFTIQRK